MANSNRDSRGRWSSATISPHTPSTTPLAGGLGAAAQLTHNDKWAGDADQTAALLGKSGGGGSGTRQGGGGGKAPPKPRDFGAGYKALGLGQGSKWDTLGGKIKDGADQGAASAEAGRAAVDDAWGAPTAGPNDQAARAMGYGSNEGANTHSYGMPGGPSSHGADVPGSGTDFGGTDFGGVPGPGPRDWSPQPPASDDPTGAPGGTPGGGPNPEDL
jgi:hypothetical protein